MNPDFWAGRKVLVTGHTGFKGSWLCLWLKRLGADVVGYALEPPTIPSLFVAAGVASSIESIRGDVRDVEQLTAVISRHEPQVVLHLAAQSVVRASYDDPIETYSTNVIGTASILQAVRNVPGPRTIVNVTTDKVYQNNEWIWGYRENDRLGGHDPYSNSKACAELVTQAFVASYFPIAKLHEHRVGVATARAGNVIGGGDWTKDQLIPDIVRAFSANEPVLIRQPRSVRPWQHVLDCLSGYMLLAERLGAADPDAAGAWNFGPALDDAQPVSWLVEHLVDAWGGEAAWKLDAAVHPHEAQLLRLDNSKAIKTLGWRPRLALADALDWTVSWYKSHRDNRSAHELCLEQIDSYAHLA